MKRCFISILLAILVIGSIFAAGCYYDEDTTSRSRSDDVKFWVKEASSQITELYWASGRVKECVKRHDWLEAEASVSELEYQIERLDWMLDRLKKEIESEY